MCVGSQLRTSPEEAEAAQLAQKSAGSDGCGQADEWLSERCRAGGERARAVVAAQASQTYTGSAWIEVALALRAPASLALLATQVCNRTSLVPTRG